jgi:hypothetical protein
MSRNGGVEQQLQPDRQPVKLEGSSGSSCSYSPQADDVPGRPAHVYSAPSGHYRHYASPPPLHQYGGTSGAPPPPPPASAAAPMSGACALEGCARYAAGHSVYCSEECRLVAGDCKEEDEEEYSSSNAWPSCMVRSDPAGTTTTSDLLVK